MLRETANSIQTSCSGTDRNYGVDLLRVIAAMMIVMLHVLSQGGILSALGNLTLRGEVLWFIQTGCFCFVNVFALISGYVGVGSKHKTASILSLWLQVFLYGLLSNLLVWGLGKEPFSLTALIKTFFPVIASRSWYFSAYFMLFLFMPLLNELLERAEEKTLRRCLLVSAVVLMLMETLKSVEEFGLRAGYSAAWLTLLYLIGGYIKKYDPLKKLSLWHCRIGFLGCMVLTFLSRILIELVTLVLLGEASYGTKFMSYTSPLMVLQAVFLLQWFSKIEIKGCLTGVIKWFAPMTFGVFIIHTTPIVYRYFLRGAFSFFAEYSLFPVLLFSLAATAGIWLACNLIDFARICLFKLVRIPQFLRWLGAKIDYLLNKI